MQGVIKIETHYKQLHENPELSGVEINTSIYVESILRKYTNDIYSVNYSKIAYFNKNKKSSLAFRSELDALPLIEDNNHEIISKNNCMHACGHDIHTSALLSLLPYIKDNDFKYNIVLIFQSKEETGGGSLDIVNSNILNDLNVDKIIGMHVWPNLEYNKIFSTKNLMYGSYELDIFIEGKSNHISSYDKYTDATYSSFLLYKKLHRLRYNKIAHLGFIKSGIMRNISSDKAILNYSIRFKKNNKIKNKIKRIKLKTKCIINYDFKSYYPPLINSNELLKEIKHIKIKTLKSAEDFGNYSKSHKILFLLYGLGKGYNLHTSEFNTNDMQRKNYFITLLNILNKYKKIEE